MSLDDLYRRVIMDHYQKPRNRGRIEDGAVTVDLNNPTCGDRVSVQMRVKDGTIEEAKFLGEGCSISLASASMMTEAVKGLKVEEALRLVDLFSEMMQGKDVDFEQFPLEDIEALSGVSKFPARIKCATLAWKALEKGLKSSQASGH
ncbi:Fe-S cluster assembly sulfur transfer protein SufU [Polycladomyces subterraneus]|uniref:SUF system NifU family Fe-S cluster assembly protein n=1 Tax=Polycladomyces subterraneus TaxID=1016997 RepID=A0ABT8IRJ4_9BACL|nr:SUF system NifU family Fe-S cluster assembly protein [Polycladomyces subterraneus]MDN4594704.1 SUF system NifU family Fe-S cluster assembly protein [Polycladomyces subterraneus]